jgi:hypothetical protein
MMAQSISPPRMPPSAKSARAAHFSSLRNQSSESLPVATVGCSVAVAF